MRRWLPGLLLLWLALVFVHQGWFDSPTPASRLDLLFAVVADGTVRIDDYHENTPDKALHRGHYYSDKAPGTVALALPAFAAMHQLLRWLGLDTNDRTVWRACSWAACAFSQALPAAFGGVLLLAWLQRLVPPRPALIALVGLWLGSLALPYSTLLFSHAQVIGLISIAIWALRLFERVPDSSQPPVPPWRLAVAGFALGLALASEYTAGLVVVGLLLDATVRHWRHLPFLVAGAVPPLLLIPGYSWLTLGTPFELPYSHQASFAEMGAGLYAIRWPDPVNLFRLLFGPTRGLVCWTPFLVMAGVGWRWMAHHRPRWLWLTYALPLLHVVVISGRTWDWQAGYTISARYLAPILPLLALPCGVGTRYWPCLGAPLAALSVALMALATVTDACPTYDLWYPLTELHLPRLLAGGFSPNLATALLGLPPYAGAAAFGLLIVSGTAWAWCAVRGDRERPGRDPKPPAQPTAPQPVPWVHLHV